MILIESIKNISSLPEEAIVFAERINGKFTEKSDVALLELTDEELSIPLTEIANLKAPGKEYFLEVSIIEEIVEDLGMNSLDKIVNRVIEYAENDA